VWCGLDSLVDENEVLGGKSLDCVYVEHQGTIVRSSMKEKTYLSDDITWLQVSQSLDKLVHGPIKVAFGIQIISISAMYVCYPALA